MMWGRIYRIKTVSVVSCLPTYSHIQSKHEKLVWNEVVIDSTLFIHRKVSYSLLTMDGLHSIWKMCFRLSVSPAISSLTIFLRYLVFGSSTCTAESKVFIFLFFSLKTKKRKSKRHDDDDVSPLRNGEDESCSKLKRVLAPCWGGFISHLLILEICFARNVIGINDSHSSPSLCVLRNEKKGERLLLWSSSSSSQLAKDDSHKSTIVWKFNSMFGWSSQCSTFHAHSHLQFRMMTRCWREIMSYIKLLCLFFAAAHRRHCRIFSSFSFCFLNH